MAAATLTPHRVNNTLVEHYRYQQQKIERSDSWSDDSSSRSKQESSESMSGKCPSGPLQTRPEATHYAFSVTGQDSSESVHTNSDSSDLHSRKSMARKKKGDAGGIDADLEQIAVEVEQPVPTEKRGQLAFTLASKSALHEARRCIPCASMEVRRFCKDGDFCKFCHLSHDDHKMQRPGKEVRLQCKKALKELMDRHFDSERDRVAAIQSLLDRQSPFVRKYTHKLLGDESIASKCVLDATGGVTISPEVGAGGYSPGLLQEGLPKGAKGGKRGQKANQQSLGKGRVSL